MSFDPEKIRESLIQFKVSEKEYMESVALQEKKVARLQAQVDQLPIQADPLIPHPQVIELKNEEGKLAKLKMDLEEIRMEIETLLAQMQRKPNPNAKAQELLSGMESLLGKDSQQMAQEKSFKEISLEEQLNALKKKRDEK